jgi:hypothetical protein
MAHEEFFNDPVKLICSIDEQGHTMPQTLTWKEEPHTVVSVGRQWEEENGRHVLAEVADGTRFELQLNRDDLVWYIRRVWRAVIAA